MKHLKYFKESNNRQLDDMDEAREVLSQIYDIEDELKLGRNYGDFLVDVDQFIEYAEKHNGFFGGNYFQSLSQFKHDLLEDEIESINSIIGEKPTIYVAPFWFTRTYDDILKFKDVYSNTIYIEVKSSIIDRIFKDEEYKSDLSSKIRDLQERIGADEAFIMRESVNGVRYLRLWWD